MRDPRTMPAEAPPEAADWFALMKRGDFAAAWEISDRALALARDAEREGDEQWRKPRHVQRVWKGGPVDGRRVLVRCYHGLGDTLQFIRYMPLLKARAREVIVWCQPSLMQLVRSVDGVDRVLPLHDGAPDVAFEVDVELMELPHLFRTTMETVPREVPYLRIANMSRMQDLPGMRTRAGGIGLAWRAGDWDRDRSIPWPALVRTFGADLLSRCYPLHEGLTADERRVFPHWEPDRTVDALADRICGLDLVITVDTMAAHLSGALGKPTWLLLHAHPDWRWMTGRRECVWYPSMTLYRQQHHGEWDPVLAQVKADSERRSRSAVASGA